MSIVNVSQIFITKMTSEDIEQVIQIEAEAYGEHHWSKSAFYDEMQNNLAKYYVAKTHDGEIVGYAGTWHIIDEGHITTIAVKKSHLRKHSGEAIIVKIIEDCYKEGIKYRTLEVIVSNTPAILEKVITKIIMKTLLLCGQKTFFMRNSKLSIKKI